MKKLMSLIAATSVLFSFAYAKSIDTAGSKLIQKITQGQLSATQEFKAPMELQGYVAQAPNGQKTIVFTSKDGQYIFVGNILKLDAKGQPVNVTQQFVSQYINAPKAQMALTQIHKTHYITDSKNAKAPAMYVLWDPNCAYCHLIFKELRPMIDAGKVQVRWVPVAIRPNSESKTAEVLNAKNDKEALALMTKDEAKFSMKTEQGSLKGLAKKDKANAKAFEATKSNTKYFMDNHFIGTPVLLYKDKQGQARMVPGFLPKQALVAMLAKVSNQW